MRKATLGAMKRGERGATLVFVAISLAALLGVMALAIDLSMLYVGRSEAQRAADAAALAGATAFSQATCVKPGGDCSSDTNAQSAARKQAQAIGATNFVLQQQVSIADTDVVFTFPSAALNEPQTTVTVRRTGIPLIFAKVLGEKYGNVSATATAEATQASTVGCTVPFLLANCDTNPNPTTSQVNPPNMCPSFLNPNTNQSQTAAYFIDPNTGNVDSAIVGQPMLLHTASSNGTVVPSQWYLAGITGTGSTVGAPSASLLRSNIKYCSQNAITCGDAGISIPSIPGNKIGPVNQGVDSLIDASSEGPNQGQNYISGFTDGVPNIYTSDGQRIGDLSQSNSVVTVPVYSKVNGAATTSLNQGYQNTVYVVGFAQLFINYVESPGNHNSLPAPCNNPAQVGQPPYNDGPVCVTVLNLLPCPGNSVNSSASPVPVRLIQGPQQSGSR